MLEADYEKKADEIIEKVKALQIEKVKSWRDALKLIPDIIKSVEEECWGLRDYDKRTLAVTIANKLVDVPYLPELAEKMIFEAAIDLTIDVLNRYFGQLWFEKIIK